MTTNHWFLHTISTQHGLVKMEKIGKGVINRSKEKTWKEASQYVLWSLVQQGTREA